MNYEMKKPKKDKELPSVLSEKSISKIISSVDNLKHIADILAKLEYIRTKGADINKLGEMAGNYRIYSKQERR